MDVFKYSLQTSALQLIHLTFLSRVAQIIFHSRRSFYLKCQNCRICGFHTVFIWSKAPLNEKERENRLCFFSIPCFVRVLKVTRLVSAGAFHMLQLSACIWHLRVTSVKAGKEMTSSPSLCSLALSLSQEPWYLSGGRGKLKVLWYAEIASATSADARVSTGFEESGCDNEVIKRWQCGTPAKSKQHPRAGHLLRPILVFLFVLGSLILNRSGQLCVLCMM